MRDCCLFVCAVYYIILKCIKMDCHRILIAFRDSNILCMYVCKKVIDLLKDAIIEENIPYPLKVARLYLISDILHNSGAAVKNASLYRYRTVNIRCVCVTFFMCFNMDILYRKIYLNVAINVCLFLNLFFTRSMMYCEMSRGE